jgi:hypothetical protein
MKLRARQRLGLLCLVLLASFTAPTVAPVRADSYLTVYLFNGNTKGAQTFTVILGLEGLTDHRGTTARLVLPQAEVYEELERPADSRWLLWVDVLPDSGIPGQMDVPPATTAPDFMCSLLVEKPSFLQWVNVIVEWSPDGQPQCEFNQR